jgi:hypothetical protein
LNTATTDAVNGANATADAVQPVAQAATHKVFRPASPPTFENKDNDKDIDRWLAGAKEYARNCPVANYLQIVGSKFLSRKPRSYFQSKYDAHKAAHGDMLGLMILGRFSETL